MFPANQTLCLYLIVLRSLSKQVFIEDNKVLNTLFHELDKISCYINSNTENQLQVNNDIKGNIGKQKNISVIVSKLPSFHIFLQGFFIMV